ncbi:hypothetical protein [Litorimonas sp. WD9-15]|uniref:hypothetical protein n=1 Tax=Litorimonas sp. WD9-15 TaxID=3418716 RepID=UPI003D040F3E
MPDSDLNIAAVDTAINSDGYMPGLANPTTVAEIKDIYMSSQFPVQQRVEQLQELRSEMISRDSADVEAGLAPLIDEIDRGLEKLKSGGRGNADPDVTNHLDTAVNPENL